MMNLLSRMVVSGLIASAGIAGDVVNVDKFIKNGVMMFSDTSRGKTFAKDPAVVRFKDKYFMYYSVSPGKGVEGWRIGIATSKDLVS